MTRQVRKPSHHAPVDQLSFLFTDTIPARPAATVATAPAPLIAREVVRESRTRTRRPKAKAMPPMQIVSPEDRRLTVEETAQILSVSVKTLEAWRRLGKGPAFVKLGRAVRYTMDALDAFTRERTVRNSAEGRMLDIR